MDDDIIKTVHSIFGKSVQIVDCEKSSSVRQEEVLLINGIPVTLSGNDGDAIKSALFTGQVPSVELLNQLLYQAGILKQPVQLETSLSVKSSMVTTEEVSVIRDGQILDGHTSETKEDHVYNSSKKEIWQPLITKPNMEKDAYTANLQPILDGTVDEVIPSCSPMNGTAPMRGLAFTITDEMLRVDSGGSPILYCNNKNDDRFLRCDDDDGDDNENDEFGELYVFNPHLKTSSSFANSLPPIRNATSIISNDNSDDDIARKYLKAYTKSFVAVNKTSALNCYSGNDAVPNSISQQTTQTPLEHATTSNTMHSTSSCYDLNNSDKAYSLRPNTYSSGSSFDTTKEHNYADIQNREPSQIFKSSSSNKNVKRPNLGKKASMLSSSCVSAVNPSSSSSLQHASSDKINSSDVAPVLPSSATMTSAVISITSVENGLVFRDGNLISGLLGSLIAHMVPSSQYYPDRSFIFSFLLSARLFIRPHELLSRISEIWESQQQLQHRKVAASLDVVDDSSVQAANISYIGRSQQMYPPQFADEQSRQKAFTSAQNCIRLLAEWIDTFPYDFRDERLMQHVRVLARKCVYIDNSLGKIVSNILQSLVQRLTVLEKYEEFLQTLAAQEKNDSCTITEDLATHFKMFSSEASHECHTDLNAAVSTSSNEREDSALAVESLVAVGAFGVPHRLLSSSYTTAPGSLHQSMHFHSQQNSHNQSDSSSNSVNTLGPGGSGGGINIGSCTSSGGVSNGAEIIGICDLCPNAALLAHQLTHIELERLSHIGPEEFVQAFAKENHLESFSDMKKTRNLESYVQWFNRLSYFTATEIVKYPKKKQRVRVIEFWIETARECFNIGNFNSLMAIIAGLNLSPISRLKKTWSKVQLAKFSVLEHQMDPTSNFNSYRSTLKAAMWRSEGATNERERIIIPFFSLLVKDLYFLNEGCSNRLPNGHINFEKFWQLAKQVMEFNTWKKVTCPFEKLPKVIMFLQMSSVLNENTMSMASFECEPPENNQEKGRYKTLKSETRQQT